MEEKKSGYKFHLRNHITITRKEGTAQCNTCYAQNWNPDATERDPPYKTDIYEINFGPCIVSQCKDCLADLRKAIFATLDA